MKYYDEKALIQKRSQWSFVIAMEYKVIIDVSFKKTTITSHRVTSLYLDLSLIRTSQVDSYKDNASPVSTRRRFDVHTTSITLKRRRTDVKTTFI